MPYPVVYNVTFSYGSVPPGAVLPGTQLEADFAGLHDSVNSVAVFVQSVMRSDGALNNGIVTYDSLSPGLQFSAGGPIRDTIVVGPAGAIDSTPVVFDGPTGRLVKNVPFASFKVSLALTKADVGLANVDNTSDASKPVSTAQAAAINAVSAALGTAASKNVGTTAGNVPLLDGSGLLDVAVLPAVAITDTFVVASQVLMLALTAQKGDIAIRSDLNKSFVLSTNSPSTLADWKELLTPTDAVLSVATLTGAVSAAALKSALTLVKGDVGLGNVVNLDTSTQTNVNFVGLGAAAAAADADTLPVNQGAANLKQTFAAIKTWIKSWIAVADIKDVAWPSWTPTFTMSTVGGTPISTTLTQAKFKQIGNVVFFELDVTVTNVGVGNSGLLIFSIPVTAPLSVIPVCVGMEVIVLSKMIIGANWSATQIAVKFSDNTGALSGGNGSRFQAGGSYRVL